jgi:hypothetical protein
MIRVLLFWNKVFASGFECTERFRAFQVHHDAVWLTFCCARIVFLQTIISGAPASGKGTQCEGIVEVRVATSWALRLAGLLVELAV